jgi:hypothetical protein
MLTEDQARALLHNAGDSITVGPEPTLLDKARSSRRARRLVALASAAAVTAVVAGGAAIGLAGPAPTPVPTPPATARDLVVVPALVGLSEEQATKLAKERGLRTSVVVGDSCEQAGGVIGQQPEPGAKVEPGSWVDVVVAGAPGPEACDAGSGIRAGDFMTVDRFVDFAKQPTESDPPWASTVAIGLGGEVVTEVPERDLTDPSRWVMNRPYAQRTGHFSALEQIASTPGDDPTDYELSDHLQSPPRDTCAPEPNTPPATYLQQGRAVSIEPLPSKSRSCMDWWSVDLTLNHDGLITGVFLVLGEP